MIACLSQCGERVHAGLPTACAYRGRGPRPTALTGCFFFELPQPAQFAHAQVRLLLFPSIEGRVTHPELPAEVADGGAGVGLSDGVDDLLLRKFRPLHGKKEES